MRAAPGPAEGPPRPRARSRPAAQPHSACPGDHMPRWTVEPAVCSGRRYRRSAPAKAGPSFADRQTAILPRLPGLRRRQPGSAGPDVLGQVRPTASPEPATESRGPPAFAARFIEDGQHRGEVRGLPVIAAVHGYVALTVAGGFPPTPSNGARRTRWRSLCAAAPRSTEGEPAVAAAVAGRARRPRACGAIADRHA